MATISGDNNPNPNLIGTDDADTISGGDGADVITGLGGDDTLSPDRIPVVIMGPGNIPIITYDYDDDKDVVDGGDGVDFAILGFTHFTGNITVDFTNSAAIKTLPYASTVVNVERVDFTGGTGNDTITGGALSDTLSGYNGNDTLNGGDGDDTLDGGNGIDTLNGGAGDDIIKVLTFGNASQHKIVDGGTGIDFADINQSADHVGGTYNFSNPATVVTLADGTTIVNVERISFQGGYGDSIVTGGSYNDVLKGGPGNDTLNGGGGNDTLDGQIGHNTLNGGAGNDTFNVVYDSSSWAHIDGGADFDLAVLDFSFASTSSDPHDFTFDFSNPNQQIDLYGGTTLIRVEQVDVTTGVGNDTLTGGAYDDTLNAGNGDDVLHGGGGDDFLGGDGGTTNRSENGSDQLYGDAGDDTLAGGGGMDTLHGGEDNDNLDGGVGHDFLYGDGGADTLTYDDQETGAVGDSTDVLDGGDSIDLAILRFSARTEDYTLDFSHPNTVLSVVDGTTIVNLERVDISIIGTGDLDLTGGDYDDVLNGSLGSDHLNGGGGRDKLTTAYELDVYGSFDHLDGGGDIDLAVLDYSRESAHETYNFLTPTSLLTLNDGTTMINVERVEFRAGYGGAEITAGNYDDILTGGAASDNLKGAGGADDIHGAGSNDTIDGGEGDDQIHGDGGDDTIFGGSNDNDKIWGGSGHDTVDAGLGDDVVYGDDGAGTDADYDTLKGGGGKDKVYGAAGADTIFGDYGYENGDPNKYAAGADNDVLYGFAGSDSIYGGGGNDTIYGGDETAPYPGAYVFGDSLYGGDGDDTIYGGKGADFLNGGTGADTMRGGQDDDNYFVDSSSDKVIEAANQGYDTVTSTQSYTLGSDVEQLNLQGAAYRGQGGDTSNSIYGTAKANLIEGNGGDDFLYGYSSYYGSPDSGPATDNDVLRGGDGRDHMFGGRGDDDYYVDAQDTYNGHATTFENKNEGTDTVYSNVTFTLEANFEILRIGGSKDIDGNGNELDNRLYGNTQDNTLDGKLGNDTVAGLEGNDTLKGNVGQDYLVGDSGDDDLDGGAGNDDLNGGVGKDRLDGGADRDTFIFLHLDESGKKKKSADVIFNFSEKDKDQIDFSDFDASSKKGDQGLHWDGKKHFSGDNYGLIAVKSGKDTQVKIDSDGDKHADMIIVLHHVHGIDKGDFML